MKLLIHRKVLLRTAAALAVGVLLNLLAWSIGYTLLPGAILRGVTPAARIPLGVEGSMQSIFLRIILYNLLIAGGASAAINLFRVGDLPLSFVYVWGQWILFGLFLGTNSFELPRAVRPAPSLLPLFSSSGFYEISAYTIIAAATINLFQFRQKSWTNWKTERVRTWEEIKISGREVAAILFALLVLGAANLQEALSIAAKVN